MLNTACVLLFVAAKVKLTVGGIDCEKQMLPKAAVVACSIEKRLAQNEDLCSGEIVDNFTNLIYI